MRQFLSRRRFELLALGIGLVFSVLHGWADSTPAQGELAGDKGEANVVVRAIQSLEGRLDDLKFKIRGPRKPNPAVVIAEVDEKSAQKYGLWPWPHDLIAKALTQMHKAGVAAVGLDIVFTDESSDRASQSYRELAKSLDTALDGADAKTAARLVSYRDELLKRADYSPDDVLAAAFAQAPEIVQGVITYPAGDAKKFPQVKHEEQEKILDRLVIRNVFGKVPGSRFEFDLDQVPSWRQYSAQTPLLRLADASRWMGHFSVTPDLDGTMRRLPLFAKLEHPKGLLPTFELQTAAIYLGATIEPLWDKDFGGLVGARLNRPGKSPIVVPIEPTEPATLVNHYGKGDVFNRISLADIIDGNFAPDALKGKAVLMGVTLVGDYDQRVTPFSEFEPGIYVHGSLLSNILSEDFLTRPVELRMLEILFIVCSALLLGFLLPRVNYAWKLTLIIGVAAGWGLLDYQLFLHGKQLATVMPLANVLCSAFGVIFLGYLSVDREKGRLRNTFQHYLNESVMEEMLEHPEKLTLGGDRKEMTVLFSDIRGFTTLAERMTPDGLVKFINSYLTPMTRIVFQEGGTLDKYIGDALMAFWGAPIDQPDHALRACRASVQFLQKLEDLKAMWRDQALPEFDIGVGINSGPMIVGNMGSDVRFDYTVMGDSVNLASRLEGTNKEYGTRILMSEATWLMVKDQVVARRLGAVRVKGKRKPVRIYELRNVGTPEGAEAEAIRTFEAGVDAFVEQRFEQAQEAFKKVLELWPNDAPSRRYVEEVEVLKAHPPGPGWDGVYTATTK